MRWPPTSPGCSDMSVMQRVLSGLLAVLLLLAALGLAGVGAADLHRGRQYVIIPGAKKPPAGVPVTIQEFFWYGCPHCFRLDPLITKWAAKLPTGVRFERVPDALGRQIGVVHEQAFYIARTLGILGQTHQALFDAIHVRGDPMATLGQIRTLYESVAGVTAKQFDDASSSLQVQMGVRRADDLAVRDRIDSVPTLVVGGYYKTNGEMASAGHPDDDEMTSFRKMLKVAQTLALKLSDGSHR